MGEITLNIPINQSPIPAAIDVFYDFLKTNISLGMGDRVALLGMLVEFDITPKSILYNDYVVRAFADRSVRVSPVPGQAAGDFADRYSFHYTAMLRQIVESLDAELSSDLQAQISRHKAAIEALSADRDKWLEQIENQWQQKAAQLGLDLGKIDDDEKTRKRYTDERVIFLTEKRYAQKLWGAGGYNSDIRDREIAIGSIRRQAFPDDDYAQIHDMYTAVIDELVVRPKRPDLELTHEWDAFTIQNPQNFAMPSLMDIAPGLQSIVDPRTILNGGPQGGYGYHVEASTKETHVHDREWNVSGSGSFIPFVKGSIGTRNASHFQSTIEKIRKISVHFEHLGELQIIRDRWFSSTVFTDNRRVVEFLKARPVLAEKLALLTTGVIVGRGLKITLEFKDSLDVQEWGASSSSGGGGINILGLQLGGRGGGSSSYNNHVIDTNTQTVTFADDTNTCRLVGLRVTQVNSNVSFVDLLSNGRPIWQIPTLVEAAQSALSREGTLLDRSVLQAEHIKVMQQKSKVRS